jgi:hypothetical protein
VWAKSKGSLPQGQHPANQIQLNSSFLLCDTQINFWKSAKIHPIAWRFEDEGLGQNKIVLIYCKKSMDKAFYTFLTF